MPLTRDSLMMLLNYTDEELSSFLELPVIQHAFEAYMRGLDRQPENVRNQEPAALASIMGAAAAIKGHIRGDMTDDLFNNLGSGELAAIFISCVYHDEFLGRWGSIPEDIVIWNRYKNIVQLYEVLCYMLWEAGVTNQTPVTGRERNAVGVYNAAGFPYGCVTW